MKIASYIGKIDSTVEWPDVKARLKQGLPYTPVFEELRGILRGRLAGLGLELLPDLGPIDRAHEIFLSADGSSGFVVRLSNREPRSGKTYIEFLAIGITELPSIPEIVQPLLNVKLSSGSYRSLLKKMSLEKRLGEPSPNGKLLADQDLRRALRRLYNDKLRKDISDIVEVVGDNPITDILLSETEKLRLSQETLGAVLSDESIVSKQYIIFCEGCQTQHLYFSGREQAEATAAGNGGVCAVCRKPRLRVGETYTLRAEILRGIRQGLWLESLVSDVISERTTQCWSGQMLETNEIDVLAIYLDTIVLIECKDTSFGQNDLYVTAMKAQAVEADEVMAVTTSDVHQNVYDALGRLDKRRKVSVIACGTYSEICNQLNAELDRIQGDFIKNWFGFRSTSNLFAMLESLPWSGAHFDNP